MNGARAEPCVRTMKKPRSRRTKMIGPSHHFFRTLMNAHNSPKIASLLLTLLVIFMVKDQFPSDKGATACEFDPIQNPGDIIPTQDRLVPALCQRDECDKRTKRTKRATVSFHDSPPLTIQFCCPEIFTASLSVTDRLIPL